MQKELELKILNFGQMVDIFVLTKQFRRFSKICQKFDFSVALKNLLYFLLASWAKLSVHLQNLKVKQQSIALKLNPGTLCPPWVYQVLEGRGR